MCSPAIFYAVTQMGSSSFPDHKSNDVPAIAEEIDAIEERIRRAVLDGMRLTDARRQHGYHKLQRKL